MKNIRSNCRVLSLCAVVLLSAVCLSWSINDKNELQNTKWKGTVFAPEAVEATFEFKADTFNLYVHDQIIEQSAYTVSDKTITIKKITGGSPCSLETGTYVYVIKNDVIVLTPIKDDCAARGASFDKAGYKKVTN